MSASCNGITPPKVSVLVVEDENIVALDIERILRGLGYAVLGPVSSGRAALECLEAQSPQLVLMDLKLKGDIDGVETAKTIQSRRSVPIVFITANSDLESIRKIENSNLNTYVLKPFIEAELIAAVRVALGGLEVPQCITYDSLDKIGSSCLSARDNVLPCKPSRAIQLKRRMFLWWRNARSKSLDEKAFLILQASPHLIAMFDREMNYVFANTRWLECFRLHQEAVIGKSHFSWIPECKAKWEVVSKKCIAGTTVKSDGEQFIRFDGECLWLKFEACPWKDTNKNINGLIVYGEDITELRVVQNSSIQSEANLRLMIDSVRDYSICMLTCGGIVNSWNKGAEQTLGYQSDEIQGKHLSAFYAKEDVQTGVPSEDLKIATAKGRMECEGWRVRKEGTRFWANIAIFAIYDTKEVLSGFSMVIRDVSQLKAARDSIMKVNEELELRIKERTRYIELSKNLAQVANEAQESTRAIQICLDQICNQIGWPIGHYLSVDQSNLTAFSTEIWHFDQDELRVFADATAQTRFDCDSNFIKKVILSKRPIWIPEVTQDTQFVRYESAKEVGIKTGIAFPVLVDRSVVGILEFFSLETVQPNQSFIDLGAQLGIQLGRVIERNRAQEQLTLQAAELVRSNQELEQFAYVTSHDLKEPLRMVTNYAQLLERKYRGHLDENADKYIGYMVDGSKRMQTLIADLLAYSRVGKGDLNLEVVDLEEISKQVLMNLRALILESNAEITIDSLPRILANPFHMVQLLQNLLSNAIKFHRNEVPVVHISAKQQRDHWIISVKDNGIGIEPQYAERVFVIFQRLHTRAQYSGTGIGLAICKKIVERHGGRIWMKSQPGKGTIFYFSIPLHQPSSSVERVSVSGLGLR